MIHTTTHWKVIRDALVTSSVLIAAKDAVEAMDKADAVSESDWQEIKRKVHYTSADMDSMDVYFTDDEGEEAQPLIEG